MPTTKPISKRLRFPVGQFDLEQFCAGQLVIADDPSGGRPCPTCKGQAFEPVPPNRIRCRVCRDEHQGVVTDGQWPLITITPDYNPGWEVLHGSAHCVEAHIPLWTRETRALACTIGGVIAANMEGVLEITVEQAAHADTVLSIYFDVWIRPHAQGYRDRILALPDYDVALAELEAAAKASVLAAYTVLIQREEKTT